MHHSGRPKKAPEARASGVLMMRLFPEDEANLKTCIDYLNGLEMFLVRVGRTGAVRWALHRMAREVVAGALLHVATPTFPISPERKES